MSWLGRLFRRGRVEARLDAELRDHVERQVADLVRAGMSEREARRQTSLGFGGVDQVKEACRDARGTRWAHELAQDLRYGARLMVRAPGFGAVVLLSLALGIGANSAIFTIIDGLLLRSLPVRDPQQLVTVEGGSWTNPIWEQIRDRRETIAADAFAWSDVSFDLARGGEADPVDGLYASGRLFETLGIRPVIGRLLTERDDRRGGGADDPVAVISHRLWQQRYGGAVDVIGRAITLDRVAFTIVGVAPASFLGPTIGRHMDIALPLAAVDLLSVPAPESRLDGRWHWWLEVMLRLRPGQSLADAQARLNAARPQIRAGALPAQGPREAIDGFLQEPFTLGSGATGQSWLRGHYERPLFLLMAAVGLVLLIACANVANLMLARANARRHELSARLALGASRARLFRQLLAESLVFALPGALLGLALAHWVSRTLVAQISTPGQTVALDLSLNWRSVAFTTTIAVVTCLLFGIAPALRATRASPHEALGEQSRTSRGDRRHTLSASLVVMQIALSLVLVVGAGLFVRTFAALSSIDLGLRTDRVLTIQVDATGAGIPEDERAAFFDRLVRRAAATPGVVSAALSVVPPMSGQGWNNGFTVPGGPPVRFGDRSQTAYLNAVTPDFFATYGTALLAGRSFDARDDKGGAPVIIVNEAFAKKFLTGASPIGQIVLPGARPDAPQPQWQVVGVVQDAAYRATRPPFPLTVYRPMMQEALQERVSLAVRASSDLSSGLTAALVGALVAEHPKLSLRVLPFEERVRSLISRERLVALLSAAFGGLALFLAAIGLYGVTSYAVSRRRTEIGIRMALGADARRVIAMVLGRSGVLLVIGVLIGGGVSLWVGRFVEALLYGLTAHDTQTLTIAAGALLVIGVTASWLPARRAARIDPARVLRDG